VPKFAGVIVAVILLAIFALMGTVIVVVLLAAVGHTPALATPTGQIVQGVLVALLSIPTLLAWTVAVGLLRGSNWARIAGMVLGFMLAIFGLLVSVALIALLLIPDSHAHLVYGQQALAGAGLLYFLFAAFGIWLIVYLNLRPIRQAFTRSSLYVPDSVAYPAPPFALKSLAGADAQRTAAAPAHGYTSVPFQADQRPGTTTSVERIFVLFLVSYLAFSVLYRFRSIALRTPLHYLGMTLHGPAATLSTLFLAVLDVAIALGLLRRFAPAYYVALVRQVCSIITWIIGLIRTHHRVIAARASHARTAQNLAFTQSIQIGFVFLFAALEIVVLWALVADLASIRRAAPGVTSLDAPSDEPHAVD
jgi:hypothetical protein